MIGLKAVVGLIKPELPLAAGICVIAGQFMALGGSPSIDVAIWGFLVGFLISGSAMVSNDYFDLEVDRINRPTRPLPSGLISVRDVIALTILLSVAGIIFAALLGPVAFILAIIIWAMGIIYNWKMKESGVVGNMMVSFAVASTFLFGGLSVGGLNNPMVWTFAAIAFLFDLAEEIANGAMDIEGDVLRSSRSVAILKGRDQAIRISGVILSCVLVLSIIPFIAGWQGIAYLLIVVITGSFVIIFYHRLHRSRTIEEGRREIRHLYIIMVCYVVAFLASTML